MNIVSILVVMALAIALGLLISISNIQKILKMRRIPTTWIYALPEQGSVKVTGKVTQQNLKSPVNAVPCAYYSVEVQENRSSGRGDFWLTVSKESSDESIEIEDETGKICVELSGGDLFLPGADCYESNGTRTYEKLIIAGDQLFITGEVHRENGAKSIGTGKDIPLVISYQSEESLIHDLYTGTASNIIIAILVGVAVLIGINYIHFSP